MEDEELIREQMSRTRESLTDRLETLEDRLVTSVEGATAAVRDTVTSVKDSMQEGVDKVKGAVDVPAHVRRHPWLWFGSAVAGGYVLANLPARNGSAPSALPGPGQLLKGLALGMVFSVARELLITEKTPPHLAEPLRGIIDTITARLGGTPIARKHLPFPRREEERLEGIPVVICEVRPSEARHTRRGES
jgi:hypothetical protein